MQSRHQCPELSIFLPWHVCVLQRGLRTLKDSIVREETSKSTHIGHCSIRNLGQTDGTDQREAPKICWLAMTWKRPLSKKGVIFRPERGLQFMEMFQFALSFWIHVISNGSQSIVINTAFAQTMARAVWLEVLCLLLLQLAASSCATSLLFVAKSTRRHNDLPNWYLIADVIVESSLPWWMEIASVRQVLSFCCQNLW